MFWSSWTLAERLRDLITPFDQEHIDCAAYTLAVGGEVYVTPNEQVADPTLVTVKRPALGEHFTIPPGQFAFLVTEETVKVPEDALGLISIRAKVKFRGLVNVSGFHVDPGYFGQLTFAVFNAGPVPIHLKRGQRIFLLWYASLDRPSEKKDAIAARKGIDWNVLSGVSGELQSLAGLAKKIQALGDRIHDIEKQQKVNHALLALVAGAFLTFLLTSLFSG
ncbi:MAG: deoxycytidine triphosphate deaminase [Acidobacteria bacterium]|nr:deoxycytidine triphosphate deaminase [Acidobacteriota bacterium]